MTTQSSTASDLLAAAGVVEDFSFYGPFTTDREMAVLTVPQRIQAAWLANDADMFAEVFTENGSLLMQDEQLTSREEIRAFMAAGFLGGYRGAHVTGWPLRVTDLSDNAVQVVTEGGIMLDGESEIAPERRIRAMWIIAFEDAQWRLVSHQSSPIHG